MTKLALCRGAVSQWHTRGAKFEQGGSEALVHQLAQASRHPGSLAAAAYMSDQSLGQKGTGLRATQIESIPGAGVSATVEIGGVTFTVRAGSPAFTRCEDNEDVKTYLSQGLSMYTVTLEGTVLAIFALADEVREETPGLIADLQKSGKKLALVSGDAHQAVTTFADKVGIPSQDTYAQCKPARKAEIVAALKSAAAPATICFVGDGANDSVALSAADVSISIAMGADIALACSGIVLRGSDLHRDMSSVLAISRLYRYASLTALGWCIIYFTLPYYWQEEQL